MAYTYLIGWSKHNTFYYGVRFAKNCNPKELCKTYFTSSKYVKSFIEENGLPDIIEIRKIFSDVDKARKWETKVLNRLKVITREDFLNQTNNISISMEATVRGGSKKKSHSMRAKLSASLKDRKLSEETKRKLSESRIRGLVDGTIPNHPWKNKGIKECLSEEQLEKFYRDIRKNSAHFGEDNGFFGKKHSEETNNVNRLKHTNVYKCNNTYIVGYVNKRNFVRKFPEKLVEYVGKLFDLKENLSIEII